MEGGTALTMADLLTQATALFNWIFTTSMPTIITTITSNALLFVGFMITLCGLVVGMFKRLVNVQ